jgi:hypothetical protein
MANSTASISIKPTVAFNRDDTFVFGTWVCTTDGAGSFQRRLTMTPNPSTGFVTLPEVITGELIGKFGQNFALQPKRRLRVWIRLQLELDVPVGHRHASRLLNHHVRTSHSMSTSHTAFATLARPMRRLSLRGGPARRSSPTKPQTPTPTPATTRTPPTSSTSARTPSPSPRTPSPSNRCQNQLPAWL